MSDISIDRLLPLLWHTFTPDTALEKLECQETGLTEVEVAQRQTVFGLNELPKPKRPGPLAIYIRQFKSPLIYLLLAAAAVSLAIDEITDALFIFAVLQINAIIGTVQEWKAESSAEALSKLIPRKVTVRRGGDPIQVDSAELVPGDIVLMEAGLLVPADIRLLSSFEVRADESLLTGESLPVEKDFRLSLDDETHIADRRNMLHAGSTVISGRAEGLVTLTGQHTEIGRIAQALSSSEQAKPPLVMRLEAFTKKIGLLVILAVILLVFIQLQRGMELTEIFFIAVALSVSAIPEGLPVAITVALSVGTARMAKRNVIVRSLPAVEGLGACTVIASDKTGTLTCNELTIKGLHIPGYEDMSVEGEGYEPIGNVIDAKGPLSAQAKEAVNSLALTSVLCNEAGFFPEPGGEGYRHYGDTVDVAFLVLARKLGIHQTETKEMHPETAFIPFESERKYAASFHNDGDFVTAHVKGAAEVILTMCDGADTEALLAEADRISANGYRVLALASGTVDRVMSGNEAHDGLKGLNFLGFASLIDPVRPEVPDSVRLCDHSGVGVRMITGDHPATALAIARDLNFAETRDQVITGSELSDLAGDNPDLDKVTANSRVFARVEPLQKLTIVQSLQRNGEFVAVTGDGVNDAPALRAANIGVAMGQGGTDVARGAADLILVDDNFASIVGGIEEGRIAYDNVRKVVYLLVSTGASEIVLFMLAVIAGMPIPLFAVQLLWLNLVTNGIQHVALALERGEPGILDRKPRPPAQAIFDPRMIQQTIISGLYIGCVGFGFYWWALDNGWSEYQARSALLMLMVLFENAHVFNCRSEWVSTLKMPFKANLFLFIAVPTAQCVHILAGYIPGLNTILEIEPVSLEQWMALAPLALGLVVVMELYKLVTRYLGQRP